MEESPTPTYDSVVHENRHVIPTWEALQTLLHEVSPADWSIQNFENHENFQITKRIADGMISLDRIRSLESADQIIGRLSMAITELYQRSVQGEWPASPPAYEEVLPNDTVPTKERGRLRRAFSSIGHRLHRPSTASSSTPTEPQSQPAEPPASISASLLPGLDFFNSLCLYHQMLQCRDIQGVDTSGERLNVPKTWSIDSMYVRRYGDIAGRLEKAYTSVATKINSDLAEKKDLETILNDTGTKRTLRGLAKQVRTTGMDWTQIQDVVHQAAGTSGSTG